MSYHKKRWKGARSHFDRRKNDTRKPKNPENPEGSSFSFQTILSMSLPDSWRLISTDSSVQLYLLQAPDDVLQLDKFIVVKVDLSWQVFFNTKELPSQCNPLKDIPSTLMSLALLIKLVNVVEHVQMMTMSPSLRRGVEPFEVNY